MKQPPHNEMIPIDFVIGSETSEVTNLIIDVETSNCNDNANNKANANANDKANNQVPVVLLPDIQHNIYQNNQFDLLKQAELSRRVFLYLIEKYNLSPSIILHSLYLHSGNVEACENYLSNPKLSPPWTLEEDHLILLDSEVGEIIELKGLEALRERRTFLRQVCEEAIGTWSEIGTKLK